MEEPNQGRLVWGASQLQGPMRSDVFIGIIIFKIFCNYFKLGPCNNNNDF